MALTLLPNGCKRSDISVHPKNWKSISASVRIDWYIHYRFYDPAYIDKYPTGFPVKKRGMNTYKTATERQAFTKAAIADLIEDLEEHCYNPILRKPVQEIKIEYEIDPSTRFIEALERAATYLKCQHSTMLEVKRTISNFGDAATKLKYSILPISDVKRKHIRFTLEFMERNANYWSPTVFNHYRRNLSMVFTQLKELEAVEYNPIKDIRKQAVTKRKRELITDEQRPLMEAGLSADRYTFWRYILMFFHSGARNTEMMRLQGKNVNLKAQEATYLIKKGRQYAEVTRPIKDIALKYWTEIMEICKPDDYLFGKGLTPGPAPIRPDQIIKRWKKHVMNKLGVTATQYSLKHLHSDEITAALDASHAARINAHTSDEMVNKVYAVNEGARKNERIKKQQNEFVKGS